MNKTPKEPQNTRHSEALSDLKNAHKGNTHFANMERLNWLCIFGGIEYPGSGESY